MSDLSVFIHGLAESPWFEPFIASFAGAVAGALGAQLGINRGQRRAAITSELHSINSALALTFFITNIFLTLKKQHVRPMVKAFEDLAQAYQRLQLAQRNGAAPPVFAFVADWRSFAMPRTPIEACEQTLFEKIGLNGRGLQAAVQMASAIDGVEKSIHDRNELVEAMRTTADEEDKQVVLHRYLGLPIVGVGTDARNRDYIYAISSQTDDCIYFSKLFFTDLLAYGQALRRRNRWRFWLLPKLQGNVDWSKAEAGGLLPADADYEPWLVGFPKMPTKWERLKTRYKLGQRPVAERPG